MALLTEKYSEQDKYQPHKFNIHISILCSEASVKGILGKINCKSLDASDKPRTGKTPTVRLLVSLTGTGRPFQREGPASLEQTETCPFHFQHIQNTHTVLNIRHGRRNRWVFLHTLDFRNETLKLNLFLRMFYTNNPQSKNIFILRGKSQFCAQTHPPKTLPINRERVVAGRLKALLRGSDENRHCLQQSKPWGDCLPKGVL